MLKNYTPFAWRSDGELLLEVRNKKDATPLEIELMYRLEYWMAYAEELLDAAGECIPSKTETKYKEAA